MLNINKTIEEGKALFALDGRLDIETSPELEMEIKNSMENLTELVLDFEKINYISSAGLRVLLYTEKVMSKQGILKLINVNEDIMNTFEMTGFSEILNIE